MAMLIQQYLASPEHLNQAYLTCLYTAAFKIPTDEILKLM